MEEPAEVPPQDDAPEQGPDEPVKLLPARLSRFAPPDPEGERRTRDRLARMNLSALRSRRVRIDQRLFELGLALGEPALAIPSVRGTGLVDLDRILKKLDRLEDAREQARLEREADRPEGVLQSLVWDLDWLGDVFTSRGIRARRGLLVSELGLALCACDHRVLEEYAPHVKAHMDRHVVEARRVDELFQEARLVDEEFDRRRRAGELEEEPREIDRLLARALDSVDDVTGKVGDTLADLGKTAAKTAVKTGGHAAWGLARGVARGAWQLGTSPFRRGAEGEEPEPEEEPEGPSRAAGIPPRLPGPPAAPVGPAPTEVPALIRELGRLRDDGLLTAEEFAAKKAELLRRL